MVRLSNQPRLFGVCHADWHTSAGVVDRISVGIGARLLELIPGSVSTECDARLAYDTQATISKGRRLVGLYANRGVHVDRVYIKIASTWEGVLAAEQLQREGIRTNMTLLFDFAQARSRPLAPTSLHHGVQRGAAISHPARTPNATCTVTQCPV
jgi:transaldolase